MMKRYACNCGPVFSALAKLVVALCCLMFYSVLFYLFANVRSTSGFRSTRRKQCSHCKPPEYFMDATGAGDSRNVRKQVRKERDERNERN